MKPKKLNFKEINGTLSREEMKKIMAGSNGDGCPSGDCCCDKVRRLPR